MNTGALLVDSVLQHWEHKVEGSSGLAIPVLWHFAEATNLEVSPDPPKKQKTKNKTQDMTYVGAAAIAVSCLCTMS